MTHDNWKRVRSNTTIEMCLERKENLILVLWTFEILFIFCSGMLHKRVVVEKDHMENPCVR